MKKISTRLGLAFALALSIGISTIPTPAQAVTTMLSGPGWGSNRIIYNGTTKQGFQGTVPVAVADQTLGTQIVATSASSTANNLTATTALSPSATVPYAGNFVLNVTNPNVSCSMVVFLSMSSTSQTSSTPAGEVVKPYESKTIQVQARDGITAHFQGLTGPCTVNLGVANQ